MPAPVVGATLHECDAISTSWLLSMLNSRVDEDKQTASAVVLTFMFGTGRGSIVTAFVPIQPYESVTVTL